MCDETKFEFNENISKDVIKNFLNEYKNRGFALDLDENNWFNNVKETASKCGFCVDNKLYKEDPSKWIGNTNDACEIIRIVVSLRKVTPNLFSIMKILGTDEINFRIEKAIQCL